ncbi:tRNA pseudouridine(38-40) synthase TruA [Anaplasmataceae bacterium AB001_6]|nr:tRNA pseudouridine(38-40) synthase TruA [Anaplasmataceae bacterium AB001_6]
MTKYRLFIEYDGSYYRGWQKQPKERNIQGSIERAIFKYSQKKVEVLSCSRTDAGVHAIEQVACFVCDLERSIDSVANGINFHLSDEMICIKKADIVSSDFNARKDAKEKTYLYKILNRIAKPVLFKNKAWHIKKSIDINKIENSIKKFIGYHDFTSFRGRSCQSNRTLRAINSIKCERNGDFIEIRFKAKSFLQHQIRIIVAVLVDRAIGREVDIDKIFKAKDRSLYNGIAPAHGLYLEKILY